MNVVVSFSRRVAAWMGAVLCFFALMAAPAGAAPGMASGMPAPSGETLKGEVLEVKNVDSFSYLRLKTADGETWAAVSRADVAKGAKVTIYNPAMMNNFTSKQLNRTFDKIVFGSLTPPTAGGPAGGGMGAAMGAAGGGSGGAHPPMTGSGGSGAMPGVASMHQPKGATAGSASSSSPGSASAAMAPNTMPKGSATKGEPIKVAKATGADARTVAEIVTQRTALKDKPVVLRAKAVKFTPGVMGKNWVHLQDGTGSAADGSDDVLLTTKDDVKVGDVVVFKGVVRNDVDLGSGYSYKVLVEDAKLQKQ